MSTVPFPSTLAEISAASGRRAQTSDIDDAGRARSKTSIAKPYTINDVAAYRTPEGQVRTVYDMYSPMGPLDVEPGLARVHYDVEYHPNDSTSYKPQILSFKSVDDLVSEGVRIDHTAAAIITRSGISDLLISNTEGEMQSALGNIGEDVKVRRVAITRETGRPEDELQHFLATSAIGGTEIHASATEDGLLKMLSQRFSFLPEAEDLEGMINNIQAHGEQNGWIVCAKSRDDAAYELAAYTTEVTEYDPDPSP